MDITQIISLPIIPVILLPVTGLLCLVFYNRLASMHVRLRALQRELREYHVRNETPDPRRQEMLKTIYQEVQRLHRRSHLIAAVLICFLSSVILFSICAFLVAYSLYFPALQRIALPFWFGGPVLICIAAILGISELFVSLGSLKKETHLIEKWTHEDHDV